ncbi:glycosyltransferase [Shewanella halotolerans]|uniref:glycosyltransferase n=1 Tax=Shewanella halotolerans TaxID=2864204 RepID=UPI001C660690|nr:glycosyltransferase [Shewanella halotolerans]QYJ88701.1 glycosyltransferase [Shewanella halotolerans]
MKVLLSSEFGDKCGGAGIVASNRQSQCKFDKVITFSYRGKHRVISYLEYLFVIIKIIKVLKFANYIEVNDEVMAYLLSVSAKLSLREVTLDRLNLHGSEIEYVLNNQSLLRRVIGFKTLFVKLLFETKIVSVPSRHFLNRVEKAVSKTIKNYIVEYPVSQLLNVKLNAYNSIESGEDGTIDIVTVARIEKTKGLLNVFEVLNECSSSCSIRWHVIGDGEFLHELSEYVHRHKSNFLDVVFYGRLPNDEVIDIMCGKDFFILLPDEVESFGIVYAEAAFVGLIPITYPSSAICEFFKECGVRYIEFVSPSLLKDDFLRYNRDSNNHKIFNEYLYERNFSMRK